MCFRWKRFSQEKIFSKNLELLFSNQGSTKNDFNNFKIDFLDEEPGFT